MSFGLRALKVEDYPRAITYLTDAINAHDLPTHLLSDAYYFRGRALTHAGQADLAMADFSAAITYWPENVKALRVRCRAYTLKDDFKHAVADCDQAVQLAPKDWRSWFTRGLLRDRRNDRAGALSDLTAAQKLMPKGMDTFPMVYRPLRDYGLLQTPTSSSPPVSTDHAD